MRIESSGDSASLSVALEQLILLIEQQLPSMHGSILILDEDGVTLRHGAAPHLPPAYCRAIDGASIGPIAGSCGTAAYRAEQVVVSDIATDPLWEHYRDLALPHGLRACWSTPILDIDHGVLGTFAMYYDEPRSPAPVEQALTRTATMLAGNIIIRARAESALRAARAEAEYANKAKSDFLAMMSHELRTPLNAIGGYAKLMLDGIPNPVTDAQKNYLTRVVKAQEHLLTLIDSVLTHAKIESGHMTYRMTNMQMSELLDVVESLAGPQIKAKEIIYDCEGCDCSLVMRGDKQKVVQILLNLLSNAVKFTPRRGRITLRTDVPAPGRATIGVRDTGIGMTAVQVATVFEAFVQFDNSLTREEKGTGLGMPISREFARGMGGELTVESEPGVGSEFLLSVTLDDAATTRASGMYSALA